MVTPYTIGVLVRENDDRRMIASAVESFADRKVHVEELPRDEPWPDLSCALVDEQHLSLALQILKRHAAEAEFLRPPLIVLADASDPATLLESGCDDVLCRPLRIDEIRTRLAVLLRSADRLRQLPEQLHDISADTFRDHARRLTIALDAAKMGDIEYDFQTDEITGDFPVFRLIGYAEMPQETGANLILDRIHHEDIEAFRRSIRDATDSETPWKHEFRVVWPDKSIRWLVARGEVYLDSERRPSRLIGVVRDATEEKQLRSDLIEAKREAERLAAMKSSFVANMSHEIRTPLTAIIGFASLLAGRVQEEHRVAVRRIQEGGQRLLETLNAVLMLARLDADQMELTFEEVDLFAEAVGMVRLFEQQAQEKGLDIGVKQESEGPWTARLDRSMLGSVLQNLISNAIKFTERGAVTVAIDTAYHDGRDFVWVHVRDSGVGIHPEFLPHIFDEFKQESTTSKQRQEGAGLGLAITRRIVSRLGGVIRVASKPGEGTSFSVGFPRHNAPPRPRAGVRKSSRPRDNPKPSVLIVEDNDETRGLLEAILEDSCYVTQAGDAREALKASHRHSFDAVLMDINLGEGASGEELAVRLFDRPDFRGTPIVALTAYALPGDREHFIQKGFSDHLAKPFNPRDLIDLIERLTMRGGGK